MTYVLGVIVIAGAVVAAAANLAAQQQQPAAGGQARQGGGGGAGGIKGIEKVANNLYFIFGNGGNTGVYLAEKGVVLVDTKLANNGQAILDQVKSVTDKPITHIINTHTHGDHNGSNMFFPANVEIVVAGEHRDQHAEDAGVPGSREQARASGSHLQGQDDAAQRQRFDRSLLLRSRPTPTATRSSSSATRASCTRAMPLRTRDSRSSTETTAAAASRTPRPSRRWRAEIKNVDTVINGHSAVTMKFQDLVDFGEFNRLFLEHARASLKAGKTPEQAMMDLKLPEKFKDYNLTGGRGGPGGNFGVIFEELKGQ